MNCIICKQKFTKKDYLIYYNRKLNICLCSKCVNEPGSVVKYFDTEVELKQENK